MTLRSPGRVVLLVLLAASASPAAAQIVAGYPPPYGRGAYDLSASLRLQVTPKETEVFVDGYYAGRVDEFDGTFQRLRVEPGDHDIQLFLPGHRLFTQKLYLQPGHTTKVKHRMERLASGEPEPERPAGAPRTTQGPRPRRGAQPRGPQGPAPGPPPQDREPAQARGDYGILSMRVQPGDADVFVDGERWPAGSGQERLLVQLAPGRHHVEVRKSGYRGYLTEVTVSSGETLPLNVALTKE